MQPLQLTQVVSRQIGPIDLTIRAGETVALSGESGSGKSLLLRAIADLDPHQGCITLGDIAQDACPPSQWRHQIAFIAAESQWWGDRVVDHFPLSHLEQGMPWLELAGFSDDSLQWSIHRLSTGEKQRLAIVRQLFRQPAVLLLDEPTASLDPENVIRIEQLLQQYQQQHQVPILWVSHDPEQRARVATHQLKMDGGRLHATGATT